MCLVLTPNRHKHSSSLFHSLSLWNPITTAAYNHHHSHHRHSYNKNDTTILTISSRSIFWHNSRAIWTTLTSRNHNHRHLYTTFFILPCWVLIKTSGEWYFDNKNSFGILGVVLTRVWCSIRDDGSRLDLVLARWSLAETHGLGVTIFLGLYGMSKTH